MRTPVGSSTRMDLTKRALETQFKIVCPRPFFCYFFKKRCRFFKDILNLRAYFELLLKVVLDQLLPDDEFNIIAFSSEGLYETFNAQTQTASDAIKTAAKEWLKSQA